MEVLLYPKGKLNTDTLNTIVSKITFTDKVLHQLTPAQWRQVLAYSTVYAEKNYTSGHSMRYLIMREVVNAYVRFLSPVSELMKMEENK